MTILKIIYSFLFFAYTLIMLVLSVAYLYITCIFFKDKKEYLFRGSKIWARNLILPLISRIEVKGLENLPKGRAAVLISNHQSYFDIPVLLGYLPGSFRFIVKKEFFKVPIFGPFTRRAGHLSVNRETGHEAHKTLMEAAEMIKSGKSVIIFPEGTRSRDGMLGVFKRGGLVIAFETGAPIVPIAISGTHKIMKRSNPTLTPGKVTLTIGKPIHIKPCKPDKEIYKKTMDFVREEISKML